MSFPSPPLNTCVLPEADSQVFAYIFPKYKSAYNLIVTAEKGAVRLFNARLPDPSTKNKIICARTLGFLFIELHAKRRFLSDTPCIELVSQIVSPGQRGEDANEVVYGLGAMYRDRLIRSFRTTRTAYAPASSYVSRPSFDTTEDMMMNLMEPSGTDYRTSRKKALARDGFRCMISGVYDQNSIMSIVEIGEQAKKNAEYGCSSIQTCHIVNDSVMNNVDSLTLPYSTDKTRCSAGFLAILKMFGLGHVVETLTKANGIHDLRNLLSLCTPLHEQFDALCLWFEPTGELNRYTVHVSNEMIKGMYRHFEDKPTFTVHSSKIENLSLPDPALLTLHGVCARVAHRSGAAKFFDDLDRDAEDMLVLAEDGSSARTLENLLAPYSTAPISTLHIFTDCRI